MSEHKQQTSEAGQSPFIRRRLRILFAHTRFPYPLIGGDKVKSYHLLKHLAAHHDVTLITNHHTGEAPPEKLQGITSLGVNVEVIPLSIIKSVAGCVKNIGNGLPLEIQFYQNQEYKRRLAKLMSEKKFDLAIGFFQRGGEYVRHLPIPKILVAEDCRVLYTSRSFLTTRWTSPHQKLARWWELRRLMKHEPSLMDDFDLTTFVTHEDIVAARSLNPRVQYRLLTNGVDLDTLAQYADNSIRRDLIFAGKLDVWANTMMVQKIVHEILPRIQERVPNVKLHIVGGYPPRSVKKLQSEHVILHPNVPDVRAFLREAAVFIHPHNGASGIQNKVLEAMSSGCAVVTTPTGIHGIPAWHQREVMIGNNSEDLAKYASMLLTDSSLRDTIAGRAQQLVTEQFAWETIYGQLDKCIDEIYPPTRIQTPGYDVENSPENDYNGLAGQIRQSALPLEKKSSYKRISK